MANEMQVFYFHRGSFAAEIFYLNGGLGRRSQQNFMLLRWSMKHPGGERIEVTMLRLRWE